MEVPYKEKFYSDAKLSVTVNDFDIEEGEFDKWNFELNEVSEGVTTIGVNFNKIDITGTDSEIAIKNKIEQIATSIVESSSNTEMSEAEELYDGFVRIVNAILISSIYGWGLSIDNHSEDEIITFTLKYTQNGESTEKSADIKISYTDLCNLYAPTTKCFINNSLEWGYYEKFDIKYTKDDGTVCEIEMPSNWGDFYKNFDNTKLTTDEIKIKSTFRNNDEDNTMFGSVGIANVKKACKKGIANYVFNIDEI